MNDFIYISIGLFLLLNLVVGISYGRNVKNLKDYALGNQGFPVFVLASTIAATWTTGSCFNFYLESAYKGNLLLCFIFSVLALAIVGKLAMRMGEFFGKLSVAEALGSIYGKEVRYMTAFAGIFMYFGFVALQFQTMAEVFASIFGTSVVSATLIVGAVIITYTVLGGMRSIVFTDFLQFFSFFIFLPVFVAILYINIPSNTNVWELFKERAANLIPSFSSDFKFFNSFWSMCMVTLFLGLQPAFFQRVAAARNVPKAKAAFYHGGMLWAVTGAMTIIAGVFLKAANPQIVSTEEVYKLGLLKYVVTNYSSAGLSTLLLISMMAMAMSSADSFINSASVLFANDLAGPLFGVKEKQKLFVARLFAGVFGGFILLFSLFEHSLWNLINTTYLFYMPTVVIPFLLCVLGFRSSKRAVLGSMVAGFLSGFVWRYFFSDASGINSNFVGMAVNAVTLFVAHYLLGEPGGWVGVRDQAPLLAERQRSARRFKRFNKAFESFNLVRYLGRYLPKSNSAYLFFGLCSILFSFGSLFLFPDISLLASFTLAGFVALALNALTATYPFWSPDIKEARKVVMPLWFISVVALGFYMPALLALLSGFQVSYFILLGINLLMACLFYPLSFALVLSCLGAVLAYASFVYVNVPFSLRMTGGWGDCVYAMALIVVAMFVVLKNKQRERNLEKKHISLTQLQRSTEKALWQIRSTPNDFKKQISDTKRAGLSSAYTLGEVLQKEIKETKMETADQEKLLAAAKAMADHVDKSAQYLEKTLHLIETGVKLERERCSFGDFLDDFYDDLSDEEGNRLLLSNQSKKKQIQWELKKET